MASDFSRTLALLRREKKISQRTAAGDLEVSQALLSHYENGLREPGLSFVVRAADYYGVSCDYLLGRSMARDGSAVPAERMEPALSPDAAPERHIVTEAVALLLDVAARSGSRQLPHELAFYLSVMVYKAFRYLYRAAPESLEAVFRTISVQVDARGDAQLKLCELRLRTAACGEGQFGVEPEDVSLPPLSPAELTERYPNEAPALLTLLQSVSDAITALGGPGERRR